MALSLDSIRNFLIQINSFLVMAFFVSFSFPNLSGAWQENIVPVLLFSVVAIIASYIISAFLRKLMKNQFIPQQVIVYLIIYGLLVQLITMKLSG